MSDLRFRKSITFNGHDSSVSVTDDGRIQVKLGARRRMELVLNRIVSAGDASLSEITEKLQKDFPDGGYVKNDVSHALSRLLACGLIVMDGFGNLARYKPSRHAKKHWQDMTKVNI